MYIYRMVYNLSDLDCLIATLWLYAPATIHWSDLRVTMGSWLINISNPLLTLLLRASYLSPFLLAEK